jgi:hypothetical protein
MLITCFLVLTILLISVIDAKSFCVSSGEKVMSSADETSKNLAPWSSRVSWIFFHSFGTSNVDVFFTLPFHVRVLTYIFSQHFTMI